MLHSILHTSTIPSTPPPPTKHKTQPKRHPRPPLPRAAPHRGTTRLGPQNPAHGRRGQDFGGGAGGVPTAAGAGGGVGAGRGALLERDFLPEPGKGLGLAKLWVVVVEVVWGVEFQNKESVNVYTRHALARSLPHTCK